MDRQTSTTLDRTPDDVMAQPLARTVGAAIGFGLSARNWDEGRKIADVLAASTLIPTRYQNQPGDVLVAMQYGAEIGLPPLAALQSIAVINGSPRVYGDGFLGVILAAPSYVRHQEYYVSGPTREPVASLRLADYTHDDTRAVSLFWRRGNPEPFVGEFSIGDAKRAKLWGKTGPWSDYPARQLRWRARGFAGRDAFAAELRGLDVDLGDHLIDDTPAPPTLTMPVRRSDKALAAPETFSGLDLAASRDALDAVERPKPTPTPTKKSPAPASPARPAPNPATADRPGGTSTTQTVASCLVVGTAWCTPPGEEPFHEIRLRVDADGAAPLAYVLITRDKTWHDLAESALDTPQRLTATYHVGKRIDGSPCKILDDLAAS